MPLLAFSDGFWVGWTLPRTGPRTILPSLQVRSLFCIPSIAFYLGTGFSLPGLIHQYLLPDINKCARNDPRPLSPMGSADVAFTTAPVRCVACPFYTPVQAEVKCLLPRSPAGVARTGTRGSASKANIPSAL